MSDLYDILEKCLQDIEKGADLDSVLFRYPAQASELRPILETAIKAIKVAVPDPSTAIIHRNRARLLQQAAEIREANAQQRARRLWSVPLRRVMVTLVIVIALFVSSTGLVRAASSTLPGDNLYAVKRTWEDVHVLFTFDHQAREALEVEHENERLNELKNVFAAQRFVLVDFSGSVTRQSENLWLVSGIAVAVSANTGFPAQSIAIGDAIHVVGMTQPDGAVLAQRIELLPSGMPLPDVKDDETFEPGPENSENGPAVNPSNVTETPSADSESPSLSKPKHQSLHGVVQSINGNIWVVDGQIMNVSSARIKGNPRVGKMAKVDGYYDTNGLFIVTRVEFGNSSSGGGDSVNDGSGSDNGGSDGGTSTNSGDDTHHEGDSGGSGDENREGERDDH